MEGGLKLKGSADFTSPYEVSGVGGENAFIGWLCQMIVTNRDGADRTRSKVLINGHNSLVQWAIQFREAKCGHRSFCCPSRCSLRTTGRGGVYGINECSK